MAIRKQTHPAVPWSGFLLIFAVALLAYLPALSAGFIWNDSDYVTAPALQSGRGLARIWFELGATQQYYPLLHTAFWVEHRFLGEAPAGYHLINVLLHATVACLFAAVLRQLWGRTQPAILAGLIFALHPVAVESVAWITEQKNTLSTTFYLLSLLAYLRFDARRTAGAYVAALALFIAAVLSKSVAATLPGAVLVVLWWRRGRLSFRRDALPLVPWFVLGGALGLLTGWVERTYIGAEGAAFALSFLGRCLVAGRVCWFYLGKVIWPAHLVFIYPRWNVDVGVGWQYLFPLGALTGLIALYRLAVRTGERGPLAAALLFVGSLFPLLGFFNVYAFIFSYTADHWQYLAMMAVIAFAAGVWGRWRDRSGASRAAWPLLAALAGLVALGRLTWRESRAYHDPETFYRTILARNPTSWMAHNNLGNLYRSTGRPGEAKREYREALRLRPGYAEAETNLGVILADEGEWAEAIRLYRSALQQLPGEARTLNNLGNALAKSGRVTDAIAAYREGLQLTPESADLHKNLALALLNSGETAAAAEEYRAVVRLRPGEPTAPYDLGFALARAQDRAGAAAQYREAIRLRPAYGAARANLAALELASGNYPEALAQYQVALRLDGSNAALHANYGTTLAIVGRRDEARGEFEAALRLQPDLAVAHLQLGKLLRLAGRSPEAVAHFQTALRLRPDDAEAHNNLGGLLAQSNRLPEALSHFESAVRLDPASASAQENLGRALKLIGRETEAAAHLQEGARLRALQP